MPKKRGIGYRTKKNITNVENAEKRQKKHHDVENGQKEPIDVNFIEEVSMCCFSLID